MTAPPSGSGSAGDEVVGAQVVIAKPEETPHPTATPASRIAALHWAAEEASAEWTVSGGTAVVENERYCLTPSGAERVIAAVPAMATTVSGAPGYGVLSAQVLASPPNVEGSAVGLAGCGVLLEINDQGQWRQSPVSVDGVAGAPSAWAGAPGLALGGQHALGILCEAGTTYLVGDGAILAQLGAMVDPGPAIGLAATVPDSSAPVCFDDLRVEVWPGDGSSPGVDDRRAFLDELGTPDAFVIEFEQTPEGGLYRVETWTYIDVGMTLTFSDGVLIETSGVDASSDDISAWPVDYDPLAFSTEMTLEDVQALLAGQELVSVEVPVEFGEGMMLYAGDQIVLGFSEGELEFVETLPITVDTVGGEP
ncbi:MAG: hypothetical protein R6X16_15040 [Anaerolineae bacterium]